MSKQKGKENAANLGSATGSFNWLNVHLTEDDERAIDALEVTPEQVLLEVSGLLSQGYGVHAKPPDQHGSVCVYLTRGPSGGGGTLGLSAWSTDFYDALVVLLYKHNVKLAGKWDGNAVTSPPRKSRR